ncbi:hypothetical protein ALP29_200361 [Pseudomonas syringae pv. avii]|uniref:Uncharacterized protein n=1 Tax=Pseudomonas syringae pv. avii TaxID=663959 RepID=A0A3M5WA10_PSESX|nr:hypothetical protein ALP29_200361 [Pseudomonas syringae pv. avii]
MVEMPASGSRKPKWLGKSKYSQMMVSPVISSSASSVCPSVARMNFDFAFVVAGLARNALRVSPTVPASHTAIWMLLRSSTPPAISDPLLLPARSRLRAVSLLPNAARKANGNSAVSKGWRASSDIADSISTAFMVYQCPDRS